MTPARALADRMARLTSGSGAAVVAPPASAEAPRAAEPVEPVQPSLAERLARMAAVRQRSRAQGLQDLVRLAGASEHAQDLIRVEQRIVMPAMHGAVRMALDAVTPLALPLTKRECRQFRAGDLLLLDTETSGLAGGSGTFVFLLGLARVEDDTLVLRQYLATGFGGEQPMLAALRDELARTRCIVTFNGKSFDVPLLKTRFLLGREPPPFDGLAHCDLLHVTRRHLRDGWPDCRLRTTESRALGFERIGDLPGAEVPAAWRRWLTHADAEGIIRVLEHNREDLVSLAAVVQLVTGVVRTGGLPLGRD
jgi:uncharacterized protein YprB with RNaseH-like and TPR domain